jgi:hypothetical protein
MEGHMPETQRHARLILADSESGPTLTAQIPIEHSEDDFLKVAGEAYRLISRLTGCNCNSGRISFVVEDLYAQVINVNLASQETAAAGRLAS